MSENEKLCADEIMVLQWLGYGDERIRSTMLPEFDRLYAEEPHVEELPDNGRLLLSEQPFGVKVNPSRLVVRNRLLIAERLAEPIFIHHTKPLNHA